MDKFAVSSLIYGIFAIVLLSGSLCSGADAKKKKIKCFNCASDFLENGDNDDCITGNATLLEKSNKFCEGFACVKVYTKMYKIVEGGVEWENAPTVVSRFCDTPVDLEYGCTNFDANKGQQQICFCNTEKCNAAGHIMFSFSSILFAALVAFLMF